MRMWMCCGKYSSKGNGRRRKPFLNAIRAADGKWHWQHDLKWPQIFAKLFRGINTLPLTSSSALFVLLLQSSAPLHSSPLFAAIIYAVMCCLWPLSSQSVNVKCWKGGVSSFPSAISCANNEAAGCFLPDNDGGCAQTTKTAAVEKEVNLTFARNKSVITTHNAISRQSSFL